MGANAVATAVLLVISTVISILLGIGVFGSQWIDDSDCQRLGNRPDCCHYPLAYRCGHHSKSLSLKDLDVTAYTMVMTAFVINIFITFCFFMAGWCWCSNYRFSDFMYLKPGKCYVGFGTVGGFLLLLCPIAGIISFAGSMMVLTDYTDVTFGAACYICIVGSSLLIIASIVLFVYICRRRKEYVSELRTNKYGGVGMETSKMTDCIVCARSVNAFLMTGDVSEEEIEPQDVRSYWH